MLREVLPEQLEGARFLAARGAALLADEPGFGKTAQAIVAADYILARKVLVVTTASARANWLAEFRMWSALPRTGAAIFTTTEKIPDVDIVVVAWSNVIAPAIRDQLVARQWDVMILDESHKAKSLDAKATQVVYGALQPRAKATWCLTGTPVPNAPNDLYPMLRTLFPQALDGMNYDGFVKQFCTVKPRWIGGQMRQIVTGGKNEEELGGRLAPHFLRRKADSLPPIRYSTYTLAAHKARDVFPLLEKDLDVEAILAAAEAGERVSDDVHLGTVLRGTGILKAHAAAELLKEELEDGKYDKIVVFHWHTEVGAIIRGALNRHGVVGIDGHTRADKRQGIVERFQTDPSTKVFVGQIVAAGEAITLTAANQCFFVEASLVPKDMAQAVRRILRRGQTRPCFCRVAALSGSIDEALMRIVTKKVATIQKILGD
jgi:SWI/SNF-related matrix-associated actin-dependent regulator 1 of chromatin subfamily A